jgi:hypothetical protein
MKTKTPQGTLLSDRFVAFIAASLSFPFISRTRDLVSYLSLAYNTDSDCRFEKNLGSPKQKKSAKERYKEMLRTVNLKFCKCPRNFLTLCFSKAQIENFL